MKSQKDEKMLSTLKIPPINNTTPLHESGFFTERPSKSNKVLLRTNVALFDEFSCQFSEQGKEFESLRCIERSMMLRKEVDGKNSKEVTQCAQLYVVRCNLLAMKCLQEKDYSNAEHLLKKAEKITDDGEGLFGDENLRYKLRAATFNNLGVFYKKKNQTQESLKYLNMALDIEKNIQDIDNPGIILLNLSSVLSKMKRHKAALKHVQLAIQEISKVEENGVIRRRIPGQLSTEAIAYHIMGMEFQHLRNYAVACDYYARAATTAERDLGIGHPLAQAFQNDYYDTKILLIRRIDQKQKREKDNQKRSLSELNLSPRSLSSRTQRSLSKSLKSSRIVKKKEKNKKKSIASRTNTLSVLPPLRRGGKQNLDVKIKALLFGQTILM